ncbi:MAG: hypothetical protein PHY64_00200 [Eubacteriales bacterium]|nr:hypothetical protein [Eubacteriales bacterium]
MKPRKPLTGQTFGELTIGEYIGGSRYQATCSCGKTCVVHRQALLSGDTRSCGHLKHELVKKNCKDQLGIHDGTSLSRLRGIVNGKPRSDNTSGVTGVKAYARKNGSIAYRAYLKVCGKRIDLGTYNTLPEAAAARKAGEEKYFVPILTKEKEARKWR